MPARLLHPSNLHRLGRAGLVLFMVWLAGRHWHPYYGFTRFLQMDAASAAATLPELRAPRFSPTNTATTGTTTRNWRRARR